MIGRLLITLTLLAAGGNLYLALDGGGDSIDARLARFVLFILGVATAWPHISEDRRR